VWCNITNVCQRWRHLVHTSAFHLGVQILCTHGAPMVDTLDHLPPIPISIDYSWTDLVIDLAPAVIAQDEIRIYRTLQLRDRICSIKLRHSHPTLDRILMVMNSSFPILEHLYLSSQSTVTVTLPQTFLAPNLRCLALFGVGLPKRLRILPSLVSLVTLRLEDIRASGYTRPRLLVTRLQYLPRLESRESFHRIFRPHTCPSAEGAVR
jgi:hypothetical protein